MDLWNTGAEYIAEQEISLEEYALKTLFQKKVDLELLGQIIETNDSFDGANQYNLGKLGSESLTKQEFDLLETMYFKYKEN